VSTPRQPSVSDVLTAAQAVADRHDAIGAEHRAAIDDADRKATERVESYESESDALGS